MEPEPARRQADLIRRYTLIPDAQERLAALISRKPRLPGIPPEEQTDALRVPGCQSRVWMDGRVEEGRCRFRLEAESAMVRGLLATLCELYHDTPAEEILAVEPEWAEALGVASMLTPTRLNGLAAVRAWLKAFAAQQHG